MEIQNILLENPVIIIYIIALAVLLLWADYMKQASRPGSPQRQRKQEIKSNLKTAPKTEASGIIFGLIAKGKKVTDKVLFSPTKDISHILVLAGSGMGKTSAVLIPTLRNWAYSINPKTKQKYDNGNASLNVDISGDISSNCPDVPRKIVFNVSDINSIPFNLFGYIDKLPKTEKLKALAELAIKLMPDDPDASDGSKYYNAEGRKMLTAALIAFYEEGKDFIEICDIINANNWQNLLNKIDATGNEKAVKYINGFEGIDERLAANSKQTCDDAINLFVTDEILRQIVHRPKEGEVALECTDIEKHNIFCILPDKDLEYLKPFTQIFFSEFMSYLQTRSLKAENTILVTLDEAASLGQLDLLPCLRKYRKLGVRLLVLTQSKVDLSLTWGEREMQAMMSNFKYKVIMESSEPNEQEYWSKLAGHKIKVNLSRTQGSTGSTTEAEQKDYNIDPEEFANLGDNLILFYPGGYKKLKKNFYFK